MNGDLGSNIAVLEGCPCTNDEEHFKSITTTTRSNVALYIPNMAVEEGSSCTCTTNTVVHFWNLFVVSVFGDPRPGEFELTTAGDVEWLLFLYT